MGFLVGLYYNLTGLYWLLFSPVPIGAVAAWLALSAYCACYPALWAVFCWRMLPSAEPSGSSSLTATNLLVRLDKMSWMQRQLWGLVAAVAWTAMEMLQAHVLGGFPWNLLGVSQIDLIPLVQLASLTGVYGVSFLIAWVSLSLLITVSQIACRPGQPLSWMREIFPAGAILMLATMLGFLHVQQASSSRDRVRIALIQPSYQQKEIWEGLAVEDRFQTLLRLSRAALLMEPDLLVWPESGIPAPLENPERIRDFVVENDISLVFNETDVVTGTGGSAPKYFNAAFVMDPKGRIGDKAHKHQLVMFGEYFPFLDVFPILSHLSPIGVNFSRGESPGILDSTHPALKMGSLICFEDLFPSLARATAQANPDFLINLTNDAWFGRSQAQWQHVRAAAFRAIETGLPLVRCTNNGITCWIDPWGRIRTGEIASPDDVYKAGFKVIEVPKITPSPQAPLTRYVRDGDVFGWMCVSMTFSLLFVRELFRLRGTTHDSNFDTDLLRDP